MTDLHKAVDEALDEIGVAALAAHKEGNAVARECYWNAAHIIRKHCGSEVE